MRSRGGGIASNPVLIGAATVLVILVAVFLSYNANQGLPFVPTYQLNAQVTDADRAVKVCVALQRESNLRHAATKRRFAPGYRCTACVLRSTGARCVQNIHPNSRAAVDPSRTPAPASIVSNPLRKRPCKSITRSKCRPCSIRLKASSFSALDALRQLPAKTFRSNRSGR